MCTRNGAYCVDASWYIETLLIILIPPVKVVPNIPVKPKAVYVCYQYIQSLKTTITVSNKVIAQIGFNYRFIYSL